LDLSSYDTPKKFTEIFAKKGCFCQTFVVRCEYHKKGNNPIKRKEKQMAKITAPTVGSQFTTQKSAVTGTVTEVKENTNGTLRIKLDVNGQDRWTTVTK
jgi:hypothetical protein